MFLRLVRVKLLTCFHPSPFSKRCIGAHEAAGIGNDEQDSPTMMIGLYTESGGSLIVPGSETGRYIVNPNVGTDAACAITHFIMYQPSGTTYPILA